MRINQLPAIVQRSKKRIGRGIGSGKGGHTSSRGQKGQKVRGRIHPLFEGTKVKKSIIQRLPLQRGKGKMKSRGKKALVINVKVLNSLPDGAIVDRELLVKSGIIAKEASLSRVKILGDGELTRKLTIKLPITRGAIEKVKKMGGTIEVA